MYPAYLHKIVFGSVITKFALGGKVISGLRIGSEGMYHGGEVEVVGVGDGKVFYNELDEHGGVEKYSLSAPLKEFKAFFAKFPDTHKFSNQYEGVTPEEVWNGWTPEQRHHFFVDHLGYDGKYDKSFAWGEKKYSEFSKESRVKKAINEHVSEGSYAKGGGIKNSFEADTDKWFDGMVKFAEEAKEHPTMQKLIELSEKDASKSNLLKFKKLVEGCDCPNPELKKNFLHQINKVLEKGYGEIFKNAFGDAPSAGESFFSLFNNAANYRFYDKNGDDIRDFPEYTPEHTRHKGKVHGRGFAGYKKGKRIYDKDLVDVNKGDILLNESTRFTPKGEHSENTFLVTKTAPFTANDPRKKGEIINVKYVSEPKGSEMTLWSHELDDDSQKYWIGVKK